MRCAFCRREMAYVHGHAACVMSGCPMHGVNQAECCDGETASMAPVPTSEIAAAPTNAVKVDPAERMRDDQDMVEKFRAEAAQEGGLHHGAGDLIDV